MVGLLRLLGYGFSVRKFMFYEFSTYVFRNLQYIILNMYPETYLAKMIWNIKFFGVFRTDFCSKILWCENQIKINLLKAFSIRFSKNLKWIAQFKFETFYISCIIKMGATALFFYFCNQENQFHCTNFTESFWHITKR